MCIREESTGLRTPMGFRAMAFSILFEDREGSIWVGTSDGLDRFREFAIPTITAKQGLSSAAVNAVLAARDGSIWLGTRERPGQMEGRRNHRFMASEMGCRTGAVLPFSGPGGTSLGLHVSRNWPTSRMGSLPPSRKSPVDSQWLAMARRSLDL